MISATPCEGYTTLEPTANKASGVPFFTKWSPSLHASPALRESWIGSRKRARSWWPGAVRTFYRPGRRTAQSPWQRGADLVGGGSARGIEGLGRPQGSTEDERTLEQGDRGDGQRTRSCCVDAGGGQAGDGGLDPC